MSLLRHAARALRPLTPRRGLHISAPRYSQDTTPESDSETSFNKPENSSGWQVLGLQRNKSLSGTSEREHTSLVCLHQPQNDETRTELDTAFLRDACRCAICVDPHSGQKNFWTTQVPKFHKVKEVVKTEAGHLRVTWSDDFLTKTDHVSEYLNQQVKGWLREPSKVRPWLGPQQHPQYWNADTIGRLSPVYNYDRFMRGEDMSEVMLKCLDRLRLYGLFFLKGVPNDEKAVEKIAAKLGRVQETFYGRTWDVRSKPQAENVAYTSTFLGLHQDLCYMQATPKLQILHCLENTASGGEALFSDGARASTQLRLLNPKAWDVLRTTDVVYRYDKGGHLYENARPMVTHDYRSIWWSPPFQRPAQLTRKTAQAAKSYHEWLDAAKMLQELMEHEDYVYQYRYSPGDCVIFDNTRLLHGRKQFDDATGARWLKGTYVDHDSYMSTLLKAAESRKKPKKFKTHPLKAAEEFNRTWTEARRVDH